MRHLVGLGGLIGSGKDTVAQILIEDHGFTRVAFADKLKQMLIAIDPYVAVDEAFDEYVLLSDLLAERALDELKAEIPDVRRLLQRIGTEGGRELFGENFWVNLVRDQIETLDKVVITDVRFANEAEFVRDQGGYVTTVQRPGVQRLNNHASEALDFRDDYVLLNNGTLEKLRADVNEMVKNGDSIAKFVRAFSSWTT